MKIYATIDNRNYFDQFIGTDIWVECEDMILEDNSIYKYQYVKFLTEIAGGGYQVTEIPSRVINARHVEQDRFDNYLHSGCMWEGRVNRIKPTGNFLTDEEIYGSVGAE